MKLLDIVREIMEDAARGPEFFDPADAARGILDSVSLTEGARLRSSTFRRVGYVLRRAAKRWHSGRRVTKLRVKTAGRLGSSRHQVKRLKRLARMKKRATTRRRVTYLKAGALGTLGTLGTVGNMRDMVYAHSQYKYYRKHKKLYRPKFEDVQEIDQLITETVRRRKVATIGGVTRWRKTGRPNPIRSMRAKRTARRHKHTRKLAMQRMMRSPKGMQLRRFRSKTMSTRARNRPPGPRASRPRIPRMARRRTLRRPRHRSYRRRR